MPTALSHAVMRKDIVKIQQLIDKRVDVNALDKEGKAALHYAITNDNWDRSEYNCAKIIALLLSNNANINVQSALSITPFIPSGVTPLMIAVSKAKVEITRLLLANGADVNITDNDQKTALFYLLECGELLDMDGHWYNWEVDDHIYDEDDDSIYFEIMELLIENGARTKIRDKDGFTFLQYMDKHQFIPKELRTVTRKKLVTLKAIRRGENK